MSLDNFVLLTGPSVEFTGTESASQASQTGQVVTSSGTEAVTGAQPAAGGFGGFGVTGMILYIAGLLALFYFFIIRPQKKREKELLNMQAAIKIGDWVATSSGFYGKVVDIYDKEILVEFGTNKSVMIPVSKSEIIGTKEPNLSTKAVATEEDK